jgi:hypothetical protein
MNQPRYDTSIRTRFELGSLAGEGNIENAGPGGLFIRTATIPDRGEKVWLSFEGPNGEVVEASGVVWWTTLDMRARAQARQGFGVRLVASSGDYRKLLKRLARIAARIEA